MAILCTSETSTLNKSVTKTFDTICPVDIDHSIGGAQAQKAVSMALPMFAPRIGSKAPSIVPDNSNADSVAQLQKVE